MPDKKNKVESIENNFIDMNINQICEELSHYPNHVLCRALLVSCRIINEVDQDKTFESNHTEMTNRQLRDIGNFALTLTSDVMKDYLDNKEIIDQGLNKQIH